MASMVRFERRRNRSSVPDEALRLYLEVNAAHAGVHAVVLSDERGTRISGIGDVDLDALAALGQLFAFGHPLSPAASELADEVVQSHDLYTSRLEVGGVTWVLTSLGARFPEQRRAERAFARILQ
jgi:hypothetical protein